MKLIAGSKLRWTLVAFAVAFAAAQFVQPQIPPTPTPSPTPILDSSQTPPRIAAILSRSCGDCHSNETRWPWYARISPASWLLADHVQNGRRQLNFSTTASLDDDQLGELHDAIQFGTMPPKSYLLLHPSARLSPEESALLRKWALGEPMGE